MKVQILLLLVFMRNDIFPSEPGWDFLFQDYNFTIGATEKYSLLFPLKFREGYDYPTVEINGHFKGFSLYGEPAGQYFPGKPGSYSNSKEGLKTNLYGDLTFVAGWRIKNLSFYEDISLFNKFEQETLTYLNPLFDPRYHLHSFDVQPVIGEKEYFDVRFNRGYILYRTPYLTFLTGREYLSWGYGLLFSGYSTPFDFVYRIRLGKGILRAETFYATLNDTFPGKRISGQSVELQIHPNLIVSLEEAVVYTSSDMLKYFNPLGLYYEIQRRGKNNSDNLLGAINITWRVIKGLKLEFQFLDDDFIIGKGGTSKYALYTGVSIAPPWCKGVLLRMNYTMIPRWTYTHVTDTNALAFMGLPMGYPRGCDLRDFSLELYKIQGENITYLKLKYLTHGDGTLEEHWEGSGYPPDMSFPTGEVEKTLWLIAGIKSRIFEVISFGDLENIDEELSFTLGFGVNVKTNILKIEF